MEGLRPVNLPVATFASGQKGTRSCPSFQTRIITSEAWGATSVLEQPTLHPSAGGETKLWDRTSSCKWVMPAD